MEDSHVKIYPSSNLPTLAPKQSAYEGCRQPKVIEVFQKLWGTDDLIASFDGMNLSLPVNEKTGRTDMKPTSPWPRMFADPGFPFV